MSYVRYSYDMDSELYKTFLKIKGKRILESGENVSLCAILDEYLRKSLKEENHETKKH